MFAIQLQYRVALIIWLIGMIIEPVMYLVVWSSVADAQGGTVGNFSTGEVAAYYVVMMLTNFVTFTWVMWNWTYYVKEGALSALLLRPVHPIHQDISDNATYKVLAGIVLVPAAMLLAWAFDAEFSITWASALAYLPALLLAWILRFALEWTLALAAFWITQVNALNQLYFVVLLFCSGRLAPLELFPQWVQNFTYLLPFRWMLSFPVELLLGRLAPAEIALGFAAQVAWVAVVIVALRIVWATGVKHYSAVGA
jgi:ABC-2 type transport system permease protein